MIFRRKDRGGAAVAESLDGIFGEIEALSEANRAEHDLERETRLMELRHRAGIGLYDSPVRRPKFASPDNGALPPRVSEPPSIDPADLTPGLLRAGVLRDGCLLVRGLIDRDRALGLADDIDRSFSEREAHPGGGPETDGYYQPFYPDERFEAPLSRPWIEAGGGVLAIDSPRLMFEMMELFRQAGLADLISGYLGEPPAISAQKTTLRKADPEIAGAWHQDGAFMGDIRSINVWLSLSRCGDVAPGLDIVPRRFDDLVRLGGEETKLSYQVSQAAAEEAAGEDGILRPVFEPGDVLFFDELFLHATGSDPAMPNPRYAVESWFFGPSAFPADYAPMAF